MVLAEKYFDAKIENISEGISFINDNLKKLKVKSKDNIKAQLLAEEFLAKIISSKSEEDSEQIRVAVDKKYGKNSTVVSYKGKQIENIDNLGLDLDLSEIGDSADAEAIMSLMLSQFAVPTEALAVFIGYYVISDPFFTANNILGDFAGAYVIAKRNNLMDK